MESNTEFPNEIKYVNKAKSFSVGPSAASLKFKCEPPKRNSFNANEAVRSLDMALGRLKKRKIVDGEYSPNTPHTSPVRHSLASNNMFIDGLADRNYNHGADSASMMSMNFSHYELMRNLSHPNCNSETAFSSTTSNAYVSASDVILKNEHLERYFRSAENWNRSCNGKCAKGAQHEAVDK